MAIENTATVPEARRLQVEDIPNCAPNDQQILELVTDEDVEIEQLAGFIEESPSLVAMIIGLANSAYFSAPMPIHNVSDAIIKVLGMRMVRSIVLSVILGRSLDLTRCPNFSVVDYWTDALTTARFSQILTINSDFKKMVSVDQVYLSALLSGFGALVLIHHYPNEMNRIYLESEGFLMRQLKAEQTQLGLDQGQAGVLLGRAWSLPPMVINTMRYCHDENYEGQDWAMSRLIGEVARLVNLVRLGEGDLKLSPRVEKVLGVSSAECRLNEIAELRTDLLTVAKHFQG